MQFIGIIGLVALAAGWVPQTVETIKEKQCNINLYFLVLNFIGSVFLTIYAVSLNDLVFTILNSMTTVGAIINLYFKIRTLKGANV